MKNSKQDPFSILNIAPAFALDEAVLRRAYFEYQRRFHPDRMVCALSHEKETATHTASLGNIAYQDLRSPLKKAEILLELQGFPLSAEMEVDPIILEEMLEWQEQFAEADEERHITLRNELQVVYDNCIEQIAKNIESVNTENWQRVAFQVRRLRYLQQLQDSQ